MQTLRAQLVEHIQSANDAEGRKLREIAGAADIATALNGRVSPPMVFVIRTDSKHEKTLHNENVTVQYVVLIAVKNVRDERGGDSSDDAELWSDTIQEWLKSFKPDLDGRFDELVRRQGGVLRMTDQLLLWRDFYQLKYTRRYC